jgi:glycosyltransferase involved in cell wall biosynthesis
MIACFLPVFNARAHIEDWWAKNAPELYSVEATLVVVDNGSEDETLEVLIKKQYPRLRYACHGSNMGLEWSFRTAKGLASDCEYRFFLPADDWLAEGYLAAATDVLSSNPDVGVVYGKSYVVDLTTGSVGQRPSPPRKSGKRKESPYFSLLFNNVIPDISLYRSSCLDLDLNSSNWFKSGSQASVLNESNVYYLETSQCYSGKSPDQESKRWARSGKYFSFFRTVFSGARDFDNDSVIERDLKLTIIENSFSTNCTLLASFNGLMNGGVYARHACEAYKDNLLYWIGCYLTDSLFTLKDGKPMFLKQSTYGTYIELKQIIPMLNSENRISFELRLVQLAQNGTLS